MIKSAKVANGRAYIGDEVRLLGSDRTEIVAGFKPDKQTGMQLITDTARHWVGIPAAYYEWIKRGPNAIDA